MANASAMQSQHHRTQRRDADRVWTGVPDQARQRRSGLDEDLAWFLECGGAALGERGTLGGIVSALEHGGHSGGVPNTDLYTDQQIGWARHVYGDIEKHRWLTTAWLAVSVESQRTLLARYMPPPAEFRSDEGYGARDRFVEGAHPSGPRPVQPIGKKGKPIREKQFRAQLARWQRAADRIGAAARRTSVEATLGEFATLAVMLCANPGKLLVACRDPNKGNKELRTEALKAAQLASEKAHTEWAESKAGADKMRRRSERVRIVGAHVPGAR
jgi:hypothetical protein